MDERHEDHCKCGAPSAEHMVDAKGNPSAVPLGCKRTKCDGYRHDGGESRPVKFKDLPKHAHPIAD